MDQRAKRNGECAGCPRGPFIRHFRCDIKPIANVCVTWRVRRRDSCPRNLSIVRGIISAAAAELWNYRPRGRLRARSRLADFARQLARCAQCDKSRQNRFLRFWSPPRKNSREISERRLVAILISTWKIPPPPCSSSDFWEKSCCKFDRTARRSHCITSLYDDLPQPRCCLFF